VATNSQVVSSSPDVLAQLAQGKHPNVTVALADGRIRTASMLGVHARLDVAVLTLPNRLGVRPLAFANPADLAVGAPVVVVAPRSGWRLGQLRHRVRPRPLSQFSTDPVQTELIQTEPR
jgi:S1-C subfamily serine protease